MKVALNWLKSFFKLYRVYITLFIFLWVGIAIMEFWVVSPIRQDNRRQKKEVKKLENENEILIKNIVENDALIIIKEKEIVKLEALEKYYKEQASKIEIVYEKEKTSYFSRPTNERVRVFSKLANE